MIMFELNAKIKTVALNEKVGKTGNKYYTLSIEFVNGYVIENFINNDQKFILQTILNSK